MAEMRLYAEIIFWTAVVAIAYTYAGYPLLLMLLSKLRGKPVRRSDSTPPVTVIIAAYNEERDLAQKLENTLALDYPKSKLEVLVTSDCSTDRTDAIVRRCPPSPRKDCHRSICSRSRRSGRPP